jgi:hypothetical protein
MPNRTRAALRDTVAARRGTEDVAARMAPALAQVMGQDDKVVASTIAVRATFVRGYRVIIVALLLGFFAAAVLSRQIAVEVPFLAAGALLNLAWFTGQVNFFLAVTQQQVICYGMAYSLSMTARPGRLVLSAPRPAVIATAGRSGPLGRRLRIAAPGASLPVLLLGGRAGLRRNAAEVITALQAGSATSS